MEYLYLIWYVLAMGIVAGLVIYYLKKNDVAIPKLNGPVWLKILGWILFGLCILVILGKVSNSLLK